MLFYSNAMSNFARRWLFVRLLVFAFMFVVGWVVLLVFVCRLIHPTHLPLAVLFSQSFVFVI
jgi:hypothetical protein